MNKTELKTLVLPENTKGRDFVIGDLHGCLERLQTKLKEVKFDEEVDRLFCTGDLIDRGPDSPGCLELLREKWFFAVRGNHEQMFLTWVENTHSFTHDKHDFLRNGGRWAEEVDIQIREEYCRLIKEKMPFIIDVGGPEGFFVAHAFLTEKTRLFSEDEFVWNRNVYHDLHIAHYKLSALKSLPPLSFVKLDPLMEKITYVGHNTIKFRMLIANNLMIDTGAYIRINDYTEIGPYSKKSRGHEFDLSLLEHKPTLKLLSEMAIYGQETPGPQKAV